MTATVDMNDLATGPAWLQAVGATERRVWRTRLMVWAALVLLTPAWLAAADELEHGSKSTAVFRREYVIHDRVEEHLSGRGPYRQLGAKEFEELVAAARAQAQRLPAAASTRIENADYAAELVSPLVLSGKAELQVVQDGAVATILSWGNCSPMIEKANWNGDPLQPAKIGIGDLGRQVLLVPRPGRLVFQWSQRGRRESSDVTRFDIELPRATLSRMSIDLPEDLTPRIVGGLASEIPGAGPGLRRWRLLLEGRGRVSLRLLASGENDVSPMLGSYRRATSYDVSQRGLVAQTSLHLNVAGKALNELVCDLPSTARVLSARMGGFEVPWLIRPGDGTLRRQVVFQLPENAPASRRVLHVETAMDVLDGKAWRLPSLRPRNLDWTQGEVSLLVRRPLSLVQLGLESAEQSGVEQVSGVQGGEAIKLLEHSEDAVVRVYVQRHAVEPVTSSLLQIEMSEREMLGNLTAIVHAADGELFELSGVVANAWQIDSVEASSEDQELRWEVSRADDGAQRLVIHTSHGISADRSLRLDIKGRWRRSPLGQALRMDELRMIDFAAARSTQRAVHVRAAEPLEMDVTGTDELRLLVPSGIEVIGPRNAPVELRGGVLFADDPNAQALQVSLHRQQPRFATENHVSLTLEEDRQDEAYRVICTPESTAIERLNVHFSSRRSESFRWTIRNGQDDVVEARRWTEDEMAAAGFGNQGEAWEVLLPRPMSERFELIARRRTAAHGKVPVNLVHVLQASDQLGGVTIHAGAGTAVSVDNHDLTPIPAATSDIGQSSTIRAAFRYEPNRHAQFTGDPQLEVSASGTETAFAWRAHVTSRFELDGRVAHEAAFFLENTGQPRIVLNLPDSCELRTVYVDDVPQAAGGIGTISIDLPGGKKYPVVRMRYDTKQSPLGSLWSEVSLPCPEINLPVLQWQATILTPPGYEVASVRDDPNLTRHHLGMRDRLLGPLGELRSTAGLMAVENSDETLATKMQIANSAELLSASDGWSTYQRVAPRFSKATRFVLVRTAVSTTLAWTCFLACTAGLLCVSPSNLKVWVGIVLVTGLVAIMAPPAWATVAAGAFTGALLAAGVRLLRVRRLATPSRAPDSEDSVSSLVAAPEGSTVLRGLQVFLLLAGAGVLIAVTPAEAEEDAAEPRVYPVVIPIDAKKERVGESVFIPRAAYEDLMRLATPRRGPDTTWLITRSVYRGFLEQGVANAEQQLSRFSASFDIETFADSVDVPIALLRDQVEIQGVATIDGREAQVRWNSEGDRLIVAVPRRGRYRVVVPLLPAFYQTSEGIGFQMAIPPIPSARLEFERATGAPEPVVESEAGPISGNATGDLHRFALGATGQLQVSWRSERRNGSEVRVDEFTWLQIEPQSVSLVAKWEPRRGVSLPRTVRVLADRRLRLIEEGESPYNISRSEGKPGEATTYVIESAFPDRPLRDLTLTFSVEIASGIGKLRPPNLTLLDARTDRRYVALTIDPSLTYDIQNGGDLTAVGDEERVALPNFGVPAPESTFRLSGPASVWSVLTRSRPPETIGESELALAFEDSMARVQFEAVLNTREGHLFQHQLKAPRGFDAVDVSLSSDGVDLLHRWSQAADGTVTLFFAQPVSGQHRLRVVGELPIKAARIELPRFALQDVGNVGNRMAVFRQDEVVVDLQAQSGIQELRGPAVSLLSLIDSTRLSLGRKVGVFELDDEATGEFFVAANTPEIRCQQTTKIALTHGDWSVAADYRIQVEAGSVGTLRFEIPPSMADPIEISPSVSHRLVDLPNSQARQLVIYPNDAVTDTFSIQVRAPLSFATGERVRVPDVRLAGNYEVDRDVVVPRQVEGQQILWEVHGNVKVLSSAEHELKMQVLGGQFSAAVARIASRRGNPQVRLANIQTTMVSDNEFFSVASFDLEPSGRKACRLVMPDRTEIRRVRVAGLPVAISDDEQSPIISLGSDQLPHRIEIVYQGSVNSQDRELELGVPSLYDLGASLDSGELGDARKIEVERTFWALDMTSGVGNRFEVVASKGHHALNPLVSDLEQLSIISELVADVTSEQPNEVVAYWYRRWARRIEMLRRRIELQLRNVSDELMRERAVEQLRQVSQQQAAFTNQFVRVLLPTASGTTDPATIKLAVQTGSDLPGAIDSIVLSMPGGPDGISLQSAEHASPFRSRQVLIAGLFMLSLAGIVWLVRSGHFSDIVWRWPHVLGMLSAGLVWLLWSSALLALAVVALSAWFALRFPLPRQPVIRR